MARVAALLVVLLLLVAAGVTAGCDEGPPAVDSTAAANELSPLSEFELTEVPLGAQVTFTGDRVIWREGPSPESSDDGTSDVMSYDVASGDTSVDAWLTGLFAGREIQEWSLRDDRVAWIEVTQRIDSASGSGHFTENRVFTTGRGETRARPISAPAWGSSGDTGGYEPAINRLANNGALITWYGLRSRLLDDLTEVRVVEPVGLRVWDVAAENRRRLPGLGDEELLGLGGRQVMTTTTHAPAAGVAGPDGIIVHDIANGSTRSIDAGMPVTTPSAADDTVLVWTVLPDDATDLVDADLAACDLESGAVSIVSDAPGQQSFPTVDDGLVVWIDTPPGKYSPLPDGRYPSSTLHGTRLGSGGDSALVEGPRGTESQDADFGQVSLVGDELFWTVLDGKACTVYGAQVVTDGERLRLEPLRD